MAMSIMGIVGCKSINNDTANKVKELLHEKYNKEFGVKKLGNRLNTDSAQLYCYELSEPENLFSVRLEKNGESITDNYVKDKITFQISQVITDKFKECDTDICCSVEMTSKDSTNETDTEIGIKDFISKYEAKDLILRIAIDKKSIEKTPDCEEFLNNLAVLDEEYETKTIVTVFPMTSDSFEKCQNEFHNEMNPTDDWFNNLSEIKDGVTFFADKKTVSATAAEINKKCAGGE